ncbi:MAG TPA: hypothetical protein VF027_10310 [Sphingomicrobium sp.]
MSYFSHGIEKTLRKRNRKVTLLASVRAGRCEPPHGMTKEDAIVILSQDIADFEAVLLSLRGHDIASRMEGR